MREPAGDARKAGPGGPELSAGPPQDILLLLLLLLPLLFKLNNDNDTIMLIIIVIIIMNSVCIVVAITCMSVIIIVIDPVCAPHETAPPGTPRREALSRARSDGAPPPRSRTPTTCAGSRRVRVVAVSHLPCPCIRLTTLWVYYLQDTMCAHSTVCRLGLRDTTWLRPASVAEAASCGQREFKIRGETSESPATNTQ